MQIAELRDGRSTTTAPGVRMRTIAAPGIWKSAASRTDGLLRHSFGKPVGSCGCVNPWVAAAQPAGDSAESTNGRTLLAETAERNEKGY